LPVAYFAAPPSNSIIVEHICIFEAFLNMTISSSLATQTDNGLSIDLRRAIDAACGRIAPVWPLHDYVAVNPLMGFVGQSFWATHGALRAVCDAEMLPSLAELRSQFIAGQLTAGDIAQAITEMVQDAELTAGQIVANHVIAAVQVFGEAPSTTAGNGSAVAQLLSNDRQVWTIAERVDLAAMRQSAVDHAMATHWTPTIREEIGKHCAAHYDRGQANWKSPWRGLPLWDAWRSRAMVDRRVHWLGLPGFCKFVASLPDSPETAIATLIEKLPAEVVGDDLQSFLLAQLMSIPGWSAYAQYHDRLANHHGEDATNLVSLLAIRLAYDTALALQSDVATRLVDPQKLSNDSASDDDTTVRRVLLRAGEIHHRNGVLSGVLGSSEVQAEATSTTQRNLAQMVFCIDVRSERFRRNLESVTRGVSTFGFAGFFGMPIEYVSVGETSGVGQVPALIMPHFKIYEESVDGNQDTTRAAAASRHRKIADAATWKTFQTSSVGSFGFIETAGLSFVTKLFSRFRTVPKDAASASTSMAASADRLGPTLRGLTDQGVTTSRQVDIAESILRGIGITDSFARLVVFCGHGSTTVNNPLQAGLDCGACGGHTGKANARAASLLLNQPYIRATLLQRNIEIPADTMFVAALHDTTTDEIEFFDVDLYSDSHRSDIATLAGWTGQSTLLTRQERAVHLTPGSPQDALRRSGDWSEVRPEWGLANNASFVIGPRDLTAKISLDGRSFLHSYEPATDPGGAVLEQIMTAPVVVANWINLQYYASTVDNEVFGSGCKTIHNVVGRFGILSGNEGDLRTGLAMQSLHDGHEYRHQPLRLNVIVRSDRSTLDRILADQAGVAALFDGVWMHLVVIESDGVFRRSPSEGWVALSL